MTGPLRGICMRDLPSLRKDPKTRNSLGLTVNTSISRPMTATMSPRFYQKYELRRTKATTITSTTAV